jgi:DNA-binding transcriptional MerR regulator
MQYRVEELAAAAGIPVDTIRFYQARGLLEPPERRGRVAYYAPAHLARLREIQRLARRGFKLEQIARLAAARPVARTRRRTRRATRASRARGAANPLLTALLEQDAGSRSYSRAELAQLSGVSEPLLAAAQAGGLLQPASSDGEDRFTEADLGMCRAAVVIFGAGFPIQELLALASDHARAIEVTAERAVAIFEQRARSGGEATPDLATLCRQLLPEATRLVALHFQHTVVRRALARLQAGTDGQEPLRELASARLEVAWR